MSDITITDADSAAVQDILLFLDGVSSVDGVRKAFARHRLAAVAEKDAVIERLREALEPFVSGYSHTSVFLSSRQKMHPAGQDLYRDDVERAIAALKEPGHED